MQKKYAIEQLLCSVSESYETIDILRTGEGFDGLKARLIKPLHEMTADDRDCIEELDATDENLMKLKEKLKEYSVSIRKGSYHGGFTYYDSVIIETFCTDDGDFERFGEILEATSTKGAIQQVLYGLGANEHGLFFETLSDYREIEEIQDYFYGTQESLKEIFFGDFSDAFYYIPFEVTKPILEEIFIDGYEGDTYELVEKLSFRFYEKFASFSPVVLEELIAENYMIINLMTTFFKIGEDDAIVLDPQEREDIKYRLSYAAVHNKEGNFSLANIDEDKRFVELCTLAVLAVNGDASAEKEIYELVPEDIKQIVSEKVAAGYTKTYKSIVKVGVSASADRQKESSELSDLVMQIKNIFNRRCIDIELIQENGNIDDFDIFLDLNTFENIDAMRLELALQLNHWYNNGDSELLNLDGQTVMINEVKVAHLAELAFIKSNKNYTNLANEIEKLNKNIAELQEKQAKNPDNEADSEKLQEYLNSRNASQKKFNSLKSNLFDIAVQISRTPEENKFPKLQEAIDYFNDGKLEEAKALLKEICLQKEQAFADYDKSLESGLINTDDILLILEASKLYAGIIFAVNDLPFEENLDEANKAYLEALECAKKIDSEKEFMFALFSNYLTFLSEYSRYDDSVVAYKEEILPNDELSTVNNDRIAVLFENLASVYIMAKDVEKALENAKRALFIRIKTWGKKHEDIASSYEILSRVLFLSSEQEDALKYSERALEIRKTLLGEDHQHTAHAYVNLASIYVRMDNSEEAIAAYEKAVLIREKLYGKEDNPNNSLYGYIGELYFELENYSQALVNYQKALEIEEKALGKYHETTATTYETLGKIYLETEDNQKALEYYHKVLNTREKVLGSHNPDTYRICVNLGQIYYKINDTDNTIKYLTKALEGGQFAFDVTDKDKKQVDEIIASLLNSAGAMCSEILKHPEARACTKEALEIRKKVLGENHKDTISSYAQVGYVYLKTSSSETAYEYAAKALELRKANFGRAHEDTASSYSDIGDILADAGMEKEAFKCYRKAMIIYQKIPAVHNKTTMNVYNNLGAVYAEREDYDKALECYELALADKEVVLGLDHPETCAARLELGRTFLKIDDCENAIKYFIKALEYAEKAYQIDESEEKLEQELIAKHGPFAKNKLAGMYGLDQTLSASQLVEKIGKLEHAAMFAALGKAYYMQEDYKDSLENRLKGLSIREEILGKADPQTAVSYERVAETYEAMGDSKSAQKYYELAGVAQEEKSGGILNFFSKLFS